MSNINKLILVVLVYSCYWQICGQDYAKPIVEAAYQKCVEDVTREYLERIGKDNYPVSRDGFFRDGLKKCYDRRNSALFIIGDVLK